MRCSICVFWDRLGEARDHVLYYLKAVNEISDKLIVVVNGKLTEKSRISFEQLGAKILIRENKGLDFAAYKFGIEYIGYENLKKYKELLLTNTTCYGPIYSIKDVFDEMAKRKFDVWGLTQHGAYQDKIWLKKDVAQHIQSYFLVFNNRTISSIFFKNFFNKIKQLKGNYKSVVASYETELTAYFKDHGFSTGSYVNCDKYYNQALNPCFVKALNIIKEDRCPLIKRKVIVPDPSHSIKSATVDQSIEVLEYIKKNTDYSLDLIYTDIIKDFPMSKIKFALHLNYVLENKNTTDLNMISKIALVVNIATETKIAFINDILSKIPNFIDVYICVNSDTRIEELRECDFVSQYSLNISYIQENNSISNLGTLLYTCKHVIKNYDVVGYINDLHCSSLSNENLRNSILSFAYKSLIPSKEGINAIIDKFNNNKYLGLLTEPTPVYSDFGKKIWKNNLDKYFNFYKNDDNQKGLWIKDVPYDASPCLAFSSNFWARTKSLQEFYKHNICITDFKKEPDLILGLIHHPKEKLLPLFIQKSGFICGSTMPVSVSSSYLDTLFYNPLTYNDSILINNKTENRKIIRIDDCIESNYKVLYLLGLKIVFLKPSLIFKNIVKSIFSIKKSNDKKHKVVTILSKKFKIDINKQN